MSAMTQKMSEASNQVMTGGAKTNPKKGEKFRCSTCGMELQITADCNCKDPNMVSFQCCGKQLNKV